MARPRKQSKELMAKWLMEYKRNGCKVYKASEYIKVDHETVDTWTKLNKGFSIDKKRIERIHAEGLEDNLDNMGHKSALANIVRLKHHNNKEVRAQYSDDPVSLEIKPSALWFANKDKPKKLANPSEEDSNAV